MYVESNLLNVQEGYQNQFLDNQFCKLIIN